MTGFPVGRPGQVLAWNAERSDWEWRDADDDRQELGQVDGCDLVRFADEPVSERDAALEVEPFTPLVEGGWYARGYRTGRFVEPAPPADVLLLLMYEDREALLDFTLGLIDGAELDRF